MNESSIVNIGNPNRLESYLPEKIIGRGSRSVVYLATCTRGRLHDRKVAIKALTFSQSTLVSEKSSNTAIRSFHHPALLSVHSSFTGSGFHYFVLELCEGGSLCELLGAPLRNGSREMCSTFPLPEAQLRPILRRIIDGVTHLHSQEIVHGDIRPHNVFITGDGHVKLRFSPQSLNPNSDQKSEVPHKILCKKSNYHAPEIVTNRPCSFSSDLWSLGCLIVAVLTGSCEFEYTMSGSPTGMKLSPQAQDLVYGLLKIDPQDRTPLKTVLSHAFFDPSLPNQSLGMIKDLADFKDKGRGSQDVESDSIENQWSPVPSAIPSLSDRSKQGSKSNVSTRRIPSVSTSTTAGVKTTQERLKATSRPRLYSTSSVQVSSGIQEAWKRLTSYQQENDGFLNPSKSLAVPEAMELEPGPLKKDRVALGEVGNLRRPVKCYGASMERLPEYRGSKQRSALPLGLLSPPETHLDQSLLHEGGLCDATSSPSPILISSKGRRNWERLEQFRQRNVSFAPSMSPYKHPIPIPRISSPKSLQVAPLFPQTHKIAHGQLVILPSLNLLVDLREGDRRAGGKGDRILCVTPDGQEIKVYDAPHLSTPCVLSEPRETWMLDELPERYWEHYTFASKYLESVKKRTPWMVWYTSQAKFIVMSNGPKGDIHSSFPCSSHGSKEKRYVSGELSESFVKMKIKFSRQQDTLELSRYAPSDKQRGRGEWISKSETITVERLKLCGDFMLNMTPEERQGLVCLIEAVKLAEAAEEIYMVARPHIEEKSSTLDDIADHPLKPDGTGRLATTVSTPQRPEASPISDFDADAHADAIRTSPFHRLTTARTSAGIKPKR